MWKGRNMVMVSDEWLERLMYDRGGLRERGPVLLSSRPPPPVESCTPGACGRRRSKKGNKRSGRGCSDKTSWVSCSTYLT